MALLNPDGAQVSRWICGCVVQLEWPGGAEVFSGQVALTCSVTGAVLLSGFLGGAVMLPLAV